MLGIIWSLLFTVQAQDLNSSQIEPSELLNPDLQSLEDKAYIEEMLQRYARNAKYVVSGEIIDVRNLESNLGQDKEAKLIVDTWYRGETKIGLTVFVPHNAPFTKGNYSSVPGKAIQGYNVVMFLDAQLRVLDGNAIFYIDDEYIWRNKRPAVFLHPNSDREWDSQNPYEDYIVFPEEDLVSWLGKQRMGSWF